jgi:hypothetical protein
MVKIRNFQALFEGFVPQVHAVSVKPQCASSEAPNGAEDFSKCFSKSSNTSNAKMNSADDVLSAYWSQQLSILELQEALQKQESLNGENAFTFENYITPLFRIERVVRFQSEEVHESE